MASSLGVVGCCQRLQMPCIKTASLLIITKRFRIHVPAPKPLRLPPNFPDIEYPEQRKLRMVEKVPQLSPGKKAKATAKNLIDIRGPELKDNYLIHKQYGIRALQGGQFHHGHFEAIRLGINKKLDESRMFAVWRIEPPWKPVTHRGPGHKMGGGKGSIDHYVTPVKAGRIIIELAGNCEYSEIFLILFRVSQKLPVKADVVSEEILAEEKRRNQQLVEDNLNPFTFEYCIKHHSMGCRQWLSPYDYYWLGKYR